MFVSQKDFERRLEAARLEEAEIRRLKELDHPLFSRGFGGHGELGGCDDGRPLMRAQTAQQALAQNAAIRQNILANAIPVLQNVRSGSVSYTAGSPTVWTVLASNVGLIRRFYLELTGTVNCASSHTATPSLFGLANLLSNVQFIDQNNRLRINTTGMHLHAAASQKRRRVFGNAIGVGGTSITDPTGFGQNFIAQQGTGAVSGGTPKTFTFIWEIPVVASNTDLTGAIYANQTTSNNQLQFTLNPNAFVYNVDAFNAAYTMDVALATSLPTLTGLSWTLYQEFLDQLPVDNTGFAQLPLIDISYALVYQMINPGAIVQAQDNLYALPPFNVYNDLMLFWDNYGYAGTGPGYDINYIKVQISNTYVLLQVDPSILAVKTRNLVGSDFPAKTAVGAIYDLDFRHKPLSVNQLSSTNIVFNPNTVQAGGNLQIGQEYIWFANQAAA